MNIRANKDGVINIDFDCEYPDGVHTVHRAILLKSSIRNQIILTTEEAITGGFLECWMTLIPATTAIARTSYGISEDDYIQMQDFIERYPLNQITPKKKIISNAIMELEI